MRLSTSRDLNETAEQTWRLRRMFAPIAQAITAMMERGRIARTYGALTPEQLEDIGLATEDVADAVRDEQPRALLRRRYDLRRAWAVRTAPPFSRFR